MPPNVFVRAFMNAFAMWTYDLHYITPSRENQITHILPHLSSVAKTLYGVIALAKNPYFLGAIDTKSPPGENTGTKTGSWTQTTAK